MLNQDVYGPNSLQCDKLYRLNADIKAFIKQARVQIDGNTVTGVITRNKKYMRYDYSVGIPCE